MKKLLIGLSAVLLLLSTIEPAFAANNGSTTTSWSSVPPSNWHPAQGPGQNKPAEAWFIDTKGNKTKVTPVFNASQKSGTNSGTVTPFDFTSGRYSYVYDHYIQNGSQYDNEHYFKGSVTETNKSPNPATISYTQQTTAQSQWSVTGGISSTPKFGNDFIASLSATFSAQFSSARTDSQSTTVQSTNTISPWSTGEIDAYVPGGYSGGIGVYKVYDIQYGNYVGTYNETDNGWAPQDNKTYFVYRQY